MRNKEYPFEFSVIMAVYNVEKYLKEAVESLVRQSFGFKRIQLILVDDGSKDGSGKICDKYAARYPENIKVIHKENEGVSSARNAGIPFAEGRYINFMDSDDKFSRGAFKKAYAFFNAHENEIDVLTVPIRFFDAQKGEHWQNGKFALGARVIDLSKEYDSPLMFVNATFFHNRRKQDIFFDPAPACGEDLAAVNKILLEKMRMGVVDGCCYFYRRCSGESESLIATSKQKTSWYNSYLKSVTFALYEYSMKKYERFPLFLQYTLAQDLVWKVKYDYKKTREVLGDEEEFLDYIKNMYRALSLFEQRIVLNVKYLAQELKYYWLTFAARDKEGENSLKGVYDPAADISNCRLTMQYYNVSANEFSFEATASLLNEIYDSAELYAVINGEMHACAKESIGKVLFFDGKPIAQKTRFVIDVPLKDYQKTYTVKFCFYVNGIFVPVRVYSFEKIFPLSFIVNSYYYRCGYILTFEKNQFIVKKTDRKGRSAAERRFVFSLLRSSNKKDKLIALVRVYYRARMAMKSKRREHWLITDRAIKADDNGEAFFDYCRKYKKKQVKAVFAVSKHCEDYKRIRKTGKTVSIFGKSYKLRYLFCDMLVSSSCDNFAVLPISARGLKDIVRDKKYIFLQHGVIKDDISDWLNKYNKNIFKFVTTTRGEYQSVLDCNYFYGKDEVILTGQPRYDRLVNNPKRKIVIMPTWRRYLVGSHIQGIWSALNNFKTSDYFKFYDALLNDVRLLYAAQKYGYTLAFLPHPIIHQTYIKEFTGNKNYEILESDTQYSRVFSESSLLVTDYSSVAFDFAYLRKPVLYCQFDKEQFSQGGHTYVPGYFDYERDGFGEVCYDLQSTVETLIEYMRENCALKQKYAERIEKTFPYRDRNNCERVFGAIYGK